METHFQFIKFTHKPSGGRGKKNAASAVIKQEVRDAIVSNFNVVKTEMSRTQEESYVFVPITTIRPHPYRVAKKGASMTAEK